MNMNAVVQLRPRTLANVLLDLRRAKADWDRGVDDPDDERAETTMTDADRRHDILMAEFRAMILESTGVEWSDIEHAIQDAVL
jgi:hypothetical protein